MNVYRFTTNRQKEDVNGLMVPVEFDVQGEDMAEALETVKSHVENIDRQTQAIYDAGTHAPPPPAGDPEVTAAKRVATNVIVRF